MLFVCCDAKVQTFFDCAILFANFFVFFLKLFFYLYYIDLKIGFDIFKKLCYLCIKTKFDMDLYARLKELCKEKGVDVKVFAEQIGTNYPALHACMSHNPHLSNLKKVADGLGITMSEFLMEKDERQEKENNSNVILCPHCRKKIAFYPVE